jgi:hypothetical protein
MFADAHCWLAMLLMEGPILWSILSLAFAIILPVISRLSGRFHRRRKRIFVIFYTLVMIHVILLLRHFDFVVPSAMPDHGITAVSRLVINAAVFNLVLTISIIILNNPRNNLQPK